MPTKAAWVRYVQETARRNINVWGHVAQFQVWNEANVIQYWSGTAKQMATLTAWTDAALRAVDPSARLVAPALVSRLSSQQTWIKAFYAQKVAKKNVSAYVDALSASSSTRPRPARRRRRWRCSRRIRKILAKNRIVKPIWNTEVNYGLVGGGVGARPISTDRQVGNVIRTFVLNAANRVSRVYWYSWDLLGHVQHPDGPDRPDHAHPGRPGVQHLPQLAARRPPVGCTRAKTNTWTCTFTTAIHDPPGRVEPEPVGHR